jgi:hypothetical protein
LVWFEEEQSYFEGTVEELNDNDAIAIAFDDEDHYETGRDEVILKLSNADTGKTVFESLSGPIVKFAVKQALEGIGDEGLAGAEVREFTKSDDGLVLVALWTGGSVVVLWDGKKHVWTSIFSLMR